jgi:hypothetical protein
LGGCGIQFCQGKKALFFNYDLVDSVRDWCFEWFYAANMIPSLAVYFGSGLSVNDHWEKNPLTSDELQAIKPLLERIRTLKQQGLTGFGIIASYMHRQVQPLKLREHLGFEYSRAEDPSQMVPTLELTKEEVLECLRKVLKGVTIVPHAVPEYCGDNLPPAVSCFTFVSTFLYISFVVGTFYLQFSAYSFSFGHLVGIGA